MDQRFGRTREEIDLINRRRELRYRLKEEGMRKRYDPFIQLKVEPFSDPAFERYMDIRKRGRLPGTPLRPASFFGFVSFVFLLPYLISLEVDRHRLPRIAALKNGDIPFEERECVI